MKYLVVILIMLLSFSSKAQQRFPTGFPTQANTGWNKWGYAMSDSALVIANRDTTWMPKYSGTVVYRPGNKQFYWFDSTTLVWNVFGSNIDTTSISNRINLKLNISDTGTMLSPYLRKADTTNKWVQDIYVRNDSLFKFKNGTETFLDTLGSGGGGPGTVTSVALSMPSAFTVGGTNPITGNGTIAVSGAGTTLQYIRGNGTLATTDSGMIPSFHLKVRGLFSGTSPITYNSITGAIGITNANASGTKGAASFSNGDFSDNGSGLISLSDLVTGGTCTNCTVTFDAKGRATAYSTGTGPTGSTVDTIFRTPGIDSIYFTINSTQYAIKDSSGSNGTVTNVTGTTNRITVTNTTTTPVIDIATAYVGQTSITTLGTITTGVWNGTPVGATFGGTGQSAVTTGDLLYGSASNTWSRLGAGTNGYVLTLAGGVPTWAAGSGGGGTVTEVNSGYGITGGSITTTGTLAADTGTLKAVYLPLNLNASKTINQATRNITYTGGGQVVFDSTRHTQTYANPTLLSDSLVTFGNSITFGSNATVQDSAYVNRTAAFYGLPLTNKGVGGTVAYQACASNLAYINPGHSAMTTFCIGLNDYRVNGGGATMYRGVKNAYEAAMVNQFLASYVSASDGAVTRYGSWTTNYNAVTSSGGKTTTAAYSSTLNDSLTTDVTGTSVALGVIGLFGNLRDCIVYIDGIRVDSFSTAAQTANVGTTYQSMGKYYTGLSNAVHHVKVKVGPGSNFLLIDYIGTFVPTASMQPFVFVHVPHMDSTGYAGGSATQAIIDAGNDSLTAAYNRAFAAGLNVYLAQTNNYYIATTSSGLASDHVHPNDLGMYQIFTSIRIGLSSTVATAGTLRYSNDGHFYGTEIDGLVKQIPYTSDLTLQRVLTNGSYLTAPNYISGSNTLDFQGFSRISLRKFQISASSETAYMHGILGTQGASATLVIGERSLDTTKGFILYTSGDILRVFDMYNNVDIIKVDTSFRTLFRNSAGNSFLSNASATIHIVGNTFGFVGRAPLKVDSCTLLTIPEAYAIEATFDSLYWTNYAGVRVALNRNGSGSATTIYNGNGTLAADRNVSSGGFTLRFDGTNNSDTLVSVSNNGTSSTGLYSFGSFVAVNAVSSVIGLNAFGTTRGATLTGDNEEGAVIKSNTIRGARVQSVPASTNTVIEVLAIERGVNGSPGATGIGGYISYLNKATDNASYTSNTLVSKFTDATAASRTSQFYITGVNSGSAATLMTLDGNGNATFGTTNSIVGTATNNNAVTGNIGEEVNSTVSTYTNYTTTATYQNVTSITLTAGDWDLSAFFTYSANSSTITAASNAIFAISTTTASASGASEGLNINYVPQAALLGTSKFSDAIPSYRVSLSGTTTYYLNTQASFTVGNPQFVGSLRARRMR